jgi:hypothetical protein
MKTAFKTILFAAFVAVSIVNGAALRGEDSVRQLQSEKIDFKGTTQVASFNIVHAGEQILNEVNSIVNLPQNKVNGKQLLDIAAKIEANDQSINTDDKETAKIVQAFKDATAKLFPGESMHNVIARLVPVLQEKVTRNLRFV